MLILALAMLADAATAGPAPAPLPKPKLICRTYEETGSLVKRQKVCRTAKGWSKTDDEARVEADRQTQHITSERGS